MGHGRVAAAQRLSARRHGLEFRVVQNLGLWRGRSDSRKEAWKKRLPRASSARRHGLRFRVRARIRVRVRVYGEEGANSARRHGLDLRLGLGLGSYGSYGSYDLNRTI